MGESAWGAGAAREPHPDVVRLVELFREQGVLRYDQLGVLRSRSVLEGVTRLQNLPVPVGKVREVLVPGAAGVLPARVYHPAPGRTLPIVVYMHGGGWVLGSVRAADRPCRRLAAAAECVVVSVEYRLAPETKFPGPLEDCLAAIRWVASNRDELGGDARTLVLLGDSAGGNLAAACALVLREEIEIARQILIYPCLSPVRDSPFASLREHAEGPLMTRRELVWFWDHYLRDRDDEADPRAAPLVESDFGHVAPAAIIVAELDPLRDEGLAYAARLRQGGVSATTTMFPGAAHGFWWMDAAMTQAAELTELLVRELRELEGGRG